MDKGLGTWKICPPFNSLFYSLHSMRSLLSTSKPRSSSSNIQCMNHFFLRKLLFTSPCHLHFPFLKSKAVSPTPHTLVFDITASWNHVDLPCLKVFINILSFAPHILFRRKIAKHISLQSNAQVGYIHPTKSSWQATGRSDQEPQMVSSWFNSHPLLSHLVGTPPTSNQTPNSKG